MLTRSAAPSLQSRRSRSPVPGKPEPVPPFLQGKPPPRPHHPTRAHLPRRALRRLLSVPAGWNLTRKDGEVSTFPLDARTAAHTAQMRAVASITFNPHPHSTFSGALFYFSVTPARHRQPVRRQASAQRPTHRHHDTDRRRPLHPRLRRTRRHLHRIPRRDLHHLRNDACYRFDLVINNFCGGDVSGVQDITRARTRRRPQTPRIHPRHRPLRPTDA